MDPFLDRTTAEAICTLIVLGYAKQIPDTRFEFDDEADSKLHTDITTWFTQAGVTITTGKSIAQADFSFIVAKTPKVSSVSVAKTLLNDDYANFLRSINNNANLNAEPPYGAYIGGMSTTSTMFIIGPSTLDKAMPVYRKPTDAENLKIAADYSTGIANANLATKAVKDYQTNNNKARITYVDLIDIQTPSPLPAGSLFKSYHGMIWAMAKYKTDIANSFIFEIALGTKTTKVSSCFPCSAFMAANGRPATSTHLGRGENWNIPPGNEDLQKAWALKINEWYKAAKALPALASNKKLRSALSILALNGRENNIPAIFLEALTFEGRFMDKISSTLDPAHQNTV